jgi:hypothetical protein
MFYSRRNDGLAKINEAARADLRLERPIDRKAAWCSRQKQSLD